MSILLLNYHFSLALQKTTGLEAADGATVYFSAELDSNQLKTGDHFLIISVQLAELGDGASGVKDFRVDYRLGSHFEDFLEFTGVSTWFIQSSFSENVTIPFKKAWDGVDLEMKLYFTSYYSLGQDIFAVSDWIVFFTLQSSEKEAKMNLSFVVLSIIVVGILSTVKKYSKKNEN